MNLTDKNQRYKIISRFIFICLGLLFPFLLLEILLVGWAYLYQPSFLASKDESKDGKFSIVTLGESTTARLDGPAWPEVLERELNTRTGSNKFRVYNLGVPGTNSDAIVHRLKTEAMQYNPQLVITMMGINDIKYLALPAVSLNIWQRMIDWIYELRIYKLFAIVLEMVTHHQDRALIEQALTCANTDGLGDRAWVYEYLPKYRELVESAYPDRYSGQFQNNLLDRQGEAMLIKFLHTFPLSYKGYETLVDHYAMRSMWKDVTKWTTKAMYVDPYIRICINHNPTLSMEAKESTIRHLSDIEVVMKSMHDLSQKIQYNPGDRRPFYEQIHSALQVGSTSANIHTEHSYKSIAAFLEERHTPLIAMQYPLLELNDLKNMLGDANSGVVFVSNEENFQHALLDHSFDDLFVDNFAGVFGHTTQYGNQLIASAAADAILPLVSVKSIGTTGK